MNYNHTLLLMLSYILVSTSSVYPMKYNSSDEASSSESSSLEEEIIPCSFDWDLDNLKRHLECVEPNINQMINCREVELERGTLLHLACILCDPTKIVEYLLNNGADKDATDNRKWTPLHYACHHGYAKIISLLLAHGADKEAQDYYGQTPRAVALNDKIRNLLDTNRH